MAFEFSEQKLYHNALRLARRKREFIEEFVVA
jgi:hypothetical protein